MGCTPVGHVLNTLVQIRQIRSVPIISVQKQKTDCKIRNIFPYFLTNVNLELGRFWHQSPDTCRCLRVFINRVKLGVSFLHLLQNIVSSSLRILSVYKKHEQIRKNLCRHESLNPSIKFMAVGVQLHKQKHCCSEKLQPHQFQRLFTFCLFMVVSFFWRKIHVNFVRQRPKK